MHGPHLIAQRKAARPIRTRALTYTAGLGALLAMAAVSASAQVASDAWITHQVKTMLLMSESVNAMQVHVDTTDGRVTLYGTVGFQAAKVDAERIARQVVGVREVRNLIAVVAPPLQAAMKDQNEAVEDNVVLALRGDRALANTGIRVESADAGVVVLGGTAKSLSELQRALRIARGVAGVQRVRSVVETPPRLTEKEIIGDASAAESEGNPARDTWLTTAVKAALKSDPSISAGSIAVDTQDGVVTLFGVVSSDAARRAAEQAARSIRGVRSVQNELLVRTDQLQR